MKLVLMYPFIIAGDLSDVVIESIPFEWSSREDFLDHIQNRIHHYNKERTELNNQFKNIPECREDEHDMEVTLGEQLVFQFWEIKYIEVHEINEWAEKYYEIFDRVSDKFFKGKGK